MARRPALAICTACPPVSAPRAATYPPPVSRLQRSSAPRRARLCSTCTEPRSRATSSSLYGRSMPHQRSLPAPFRLPLMPRPLPSVDFVIALAELGTGALREFGRGEDGDRALTLVRL